MSLNAQKQAAILSKLGVIETLKLVSLNATEVYGVIPLQKFLYVFHYVHQFQQNGQMMVIWHVWQDVLNFQMAQCNSGKILQGHVYKTVQQ